VTGSQFAGPTWISTTAPDGTPTEVAVVPQRKDDDNNNNLLPIWIILWGIPKTKGIDFSFPGIPKFKLTFPKCLLGIFCIPKIELNIPEPSTPKPTEPAPEQPKPTQPAPEQPTPEPPQPAPTQPEPTQPPTTQSEQRSTTASSEVWSYANIRYSCVSTYTLPGVRDHYRV
jgi:hypothetical protein